MTPDRFPPRFAALLRVRDAASPKPTPQPTRTPTRTSPAKTPTPARTLRRLGRGRGLLLSRATGEPTPSPTPPPMTFEDALGKLVRNLRKRGLGIEYETPADYTLRDRYAAILEDAGYEPDPDGWKKPGMESWVIADADADADRE